MGGAGGTRASTGLQAALPRARLGGMGGEPGGAVGWAGFQGSRRWVWARFGRERGIWERMRPGAERKRARFGRGHGI